MFSLAHHLAHLRLQGVNAYSLMRDGLEQAEVRVVRGNALTQRCLTTYLGLEYDRGVGRGHGGTILVSQSTCEHSTVVCIALWLVGHHVIQAPRVESNSNLR
jgi:hypothetical protein